MDGQCGNTEKRTVYLDQSRDVPRAFLCDDHAPRNRKIAIKPRVPYATPVDLYADLKIASGGTFRNGSDLCGAVNVSANNGDTGSRSPVFRDCEGEQGTLVPRGKEGMKQYCIV